MKYLNLISEASSCWNRWADFRSRRDRCKRYAFGKQWDDMVTVDGERMTEEEYIRRQGSVPLKNNLIRRLVRNVVGVFRHEESIPMAVAQDPDEDYFAEIATRLLEANHSVNRLSELNARTLEEYLISGLAVYRKWYGMKNGHLDVWTDYVHPCSFFADIPADDFRGWDVSIVGQLHNFTFGELCSRFAHDKDSCARLRSLYFNKEGESVAAAPFSSPSDSFSNAPEGLCRVIEIWKREPHEYWLRHDRKSASLRRLTTSQYEKCDDKENPDVEYHWRMETVWNYYFLTPQGDVLSHGVTPYQHGSHPFVFKGYPLIDGELHSFVGDVIDQQRYTNRLITLYDWIMRSTAKGVLLFPEGALPEGAALQDVAAEWSRFNGVISYRARPGVPLPQQVSSNAANIGITELLDIQLRMFEEISGVSSALQGKLESGSVSGTLFNQQTKNALTSLNDLIESFKSFLAEGAMIDLRNIRQFYKPEKVAAIAGKGGTVTAFNSPIFGNMEQDFTISFRS